MRIAMVGPFAPPGERPRGGVEAVADVLVRELPEHGVDLTYIAATSEIDGEDKIGAAKVIYLKRVARPGFLAYWTLDAMRVAQAIDRVKPDLVHYQDSCAFNQYADEAAVVTIHGIPEGDEAITQANTWHRRVTARARANLIGAVERRARAKIGRAIVINQYVIEALPDVANLQPVHIPNPIDRRMFALPVEVAREAGTMILSGAIGYRKQQLEALRIFAEIAKQRADAKLLLAGPEAEPDYAAQCRAFAAAEGLGDKVEFLGHLDRPSLVRAYDRASLLLLCSLQETAPMVIAEGNARGLPAVGPQAFGLKSMIRPGTDGQFIPRAGDDPAKAAAILLAALDANWDRAAIRARAKADYAPEQITARTVAHYRRLLGAAA
jgi:glycosyltransferase involved in cell wall biosynthesis